MIVGHVSARLKSDPLILVLLAIFLVFGLLMVYSSTSILSFKRFGIETHYVARHVFHILGGGICLVLLATINLDWLKKHTYSLLLIALVMLLLPLVPGIGISTGGAARWVDMGVGTFQPGELCKIPFLLYLAYSLSKKTKSKTIHRPTIGLLPHLIVGGVFALLILAQPDFGTAGLYLFLLLFLLFISDIPLKQLLSLFLAFIPLVTGLILTAPYRVQRVLSFINPWQDPANKGFQILQALTSFSSGHAFGKGLGNSQGKLFFIPQAHSDFVFAVMGEETGFLGIAVFVILWSVFVFRAFWISVRCKDTYRYLIGAGAAFLLVTQSLIHMMVNLSLLPATGMNLPFVSTGGSNLILVMALTGLIMNCAAYGPKRK